MKTSPFLTPIPKLLLFDADGTIYESEGLNFEANRRAALELYDFEYRWEDFDQHVRRGPKAGYQVLELHGLKPDPAKFRFTRDAHYQFLANQLKPMPGLTELLQWSGQNAVRNIIVTSARREPTLISLTALGVVDFFEAIVSCEDTPGLEKPDSYPYEYALRLADVSAVSALTLEDTYKGIISAQAAGLRCIGIRNDFNDESELAAADLLNSDYRELL